MPNLISCYARPQERAHGTPRRTAVNALLKALPETSCMAWDEREGILLLQPTTKIKSEQWDIEQYVITFSYFFEIKA